MTYIPAWGNSSAKLMIIGESPAYNEKRALESNKELARCLSEAGYSFDNVWKSNVSKYYVPPAARSGAKIPFGVRAKNAGVDINEQLADLRTEISSINPNCILALGNTALWATTGKSGISKFRGSILVAPGTKVVATYNPAQLHDYIGAEFKGYWNRAVILFDFKRAIAQAGFPELIRPQRTLQVIRSSFQFQQFLDAHKGLTHPAIDIEARGKCLPACVGFAFTPKWGATVPLWNDEEYKAFNISDQEMVKLWMMISETLAAHKVVGQNFKYDQDKLIRLGFQVAGLHSDSLMKSFAINPELPKSLAFLMSIHTEEPYYKDEGMYEGSLEDLFMGCSRDACVTKEVDISLDTEVDFYGVRDYYEKFILHLHQLYLDVDNEGMNVDTAKRDELFAKYIAWSESLSYELYKIVGEDININSPKQVAVLLYENFKIPRKTGTGEEVLTEILNSQSSKLSSDKRQAIEIILEQRRVEKTISTYLGALPDFDGKMKTSYFVCLDTGRTSTSQLEPPIRPTVELTKESPFTGKKTKEHKPIGIAFQTMTKHGDIGADVRSQYVPDKGYVFLQGDSAQAEARVVFLLANDFQALRDIDEHDYHALTASWFFGGTENDYSKKHLGYESPIRFVGKTLRHAGHLGAGKGRAAKTVNTDARKFKINVTITEAKADLCLKIFHAKQPKIQKEFHGGIIEALNANSRTLFGGVPFGIDSKLGGRRQFFERWGDELFRAAFSYIPQRSVSDNTKAAALRLRKREPRLARLIIEAHDGLMYMIPEREVNYFASLLREEMERPIRFDTCSLSRPDLIIPCEIEVGYNYMELSKYKFPKPELAEVIIPRVPEVVLPKPSFYENYLNGT